MDLMKTDTSQVVFLPPDEFNGELGFDLRLGQVGIRDAERICVQDVLLDLVRNLFVFESLGRDVKISTLV